MYASMSYTLTTRLAPVIIWSIFREMIAPAFTPIDLLALIMNRLAFAIALILLHWAVLPADTATGRQGEVLVSAAASLTEAMKEIGTAYTRANSGVTVRFNFGASGALQQQIELGAPVDVFVSASPKEMDTLQGRNLLAPGTRADIAGNRLVLIVPASSKLGGWDDLRTRRVRHVAVSDPGSVPSGRYAQETLTKRGLWDIVKPKAVFGENVRQTLSYVATGDAEAGIVFTTDALIEPGRVRVIARTEPGKDHQPIVYPAAALRDAPNAAGAARFVAFLRSPQARAILRKHGFETIGKTRVSARRRLSPVSSH